MNDYLIWFKVLEIKENNPSLEDIKKNYWKLVKQYHPDINPNGTSRFIEIKRAYDWLHEHYIPKNEPIKISKDKENVFYRVLSKPDKAELYRVSVPYEVRPPFKLWCMIEHDTGEFIIDIDENTKLPTTIDVYRKNSYGKYYGEAFRIRITNDYT